MLSNVILPVLALAAAFTSASGPVSAVASKNCPGAIENDGDSSDSEYCCVGGQITNSVCAGWPICTGPTTVAPGRKPVCATTVPYSASNYDELVASASSRYLNADGSITASPGSGSSPSGTVASVTSTTGAAIMYAPTLLAPAVGGLMAYAALA